MQLHVPGVLLQKEHLAHDRQASDIKKKQLQPLEGGCIVFGGTIHGRQDEEHDAGRNTAQTEDEQRMRRADNLDVEAVSVMPPVIERSRGEHGDASPAGEENAQRGAQPKNTDRRGRELRVAEKSALDDQPRADDAGEHTAGVDGHVRRGPESIPADGPVPGDVPGAPDGGGGNGQHANPDVPGDGARRA